MKSEKEASTNEPKVEEPSIITSIKIENPSTVNKKRKTGIKSTSNSSSNESSVNNKSQISSVKVDGSTDDYKPFSLSDLKQSIASLRKLVPPNSIPNNNSESVRHWAQQMQAVLEEFNLLLACISPATYKWGTDRTGAADQNLTLLFSEINTAQEHISSSVTSRISNVLAPVVDIVTSKSSKKRSSDTLTNTTEEIKTNEFSHKLVDPSYVQMCESILHRNARMLRQVVLANFHKIEKVMEDYIQATKKDGQTNHNAFSY